MPKDINVVGSTNANKVFDLPLQLQPGQVNTLSFSQDSISSMHLTPKNELEVSFRDGSKVLIGNFDELANSAMSCGRDTLIQLSDNTIIYPDQLRDQLSKGSVDFTGQENGVIALDEPKAGQILTKNIESGNEYKLGFTLDGVNAAQSGHNLLLTFKDGGVLVLNNYFTAVNSELPPAMTLADGATIDAAALLTSCKLVEIPNAAEAILADATPQTNLQQSVPNVEPAAGESGTKAEVVHAKSDNANSVANIEPAAGDAGNALLGSSRGYGFGSSIDGASFGGKNAIGPIGATALNYRAPTVAPLPSLSGVEGGSQRINSTPLLSPAVSIEDETSFSSVNGVINVDYGNDAPGALTFNDNFTSGYKLTSHGDPIVVAHTGNTYTGTVNGETVFTLVMDTVTGKYTFTQLKEIDHADATNPNDYVPLVFGVTATDADGDTATTTITVNVYDDGPVAVDDGAFIVNNQSSISGNVLTNDDAGSDGLGSVTKVTFNGVDYTVPATGTVSVVGQYGTLKIAADGSYTYTSANTNLGTDKFTYKIVDQDGDVATANLTVAVNDIDEQPCVVNAESVIDETNVAPDGTESVSGKVNANFFGDGPGKIDATGSFSSGGSLKAGALTSNGVPVAVTMTGDVYTGTANGKVVFTLIVKDDGSYTYTQVGQLDHADGTNPNDVITLNFGFVATDADGDKANGTITVKVLDDAPTAADDVATLASAPGSVSGNVTSNDNVGEDKPGFVVKAVTFEGKTVDVPATGTVTIAGAHGNLTIGSSGAYTYSGTSVGSDKFTYKIVDQDGDVATANLTVAVNDIDEQPCVVNAESVIDETNVAPDGTESVSGKVNANFFGDGPGKIDATGSFSSGGSLKAGALTSNGVPVAVTMTGDVYTGTANGKVVFTLIVKDDGSYTYTQVGQLDHADGTNPNDVITLNFGFVATDADGDKANGTITVKVLDDAPTAADDVATLASAPGSVSGNVTSNDNVGEDKPGFVVKAVTFEGKTVDVPATGTVTIAGAHGNLTIGSSGAYTYSGTSVGSDKFTYKIVDQDGDVATANLTVAVNDIDEQPCVVNAESVIDETNVAPDGTESVSGKVNANFFGDGPGKIDATGSFSSGGSLKAGALTSNGVPVAVTMTGDVYTGTANGKVVFTLTVKDDGSYTYTQVGQLDHADGTNPNDVITLNFGFVATDADGDKANGTITVKVLDDAPLAKDDGVQNITTVVNGNVLSNDSKGLDVATPVVGVAYKGVNYTVPSSGTTTVNADHGTLVIKADGSYTYTPKGSGSDDFTYTIQDRDGDTSSAHLVLQVQDNLCVDVNVAPDCVCVKEDGCVDVPVTANVAGGSGNETLTLTLTGVNPSWGFSAAGWVKNTDGSYSITLPQGQSAYSGQFRFAPPANSDVDLNGLKVVATVYDPDLSVTKTDTDGFNVVVDAVADIPTLNVTLPTAANTDLTHWSFSNYYNYLYWGQGYQKEFTIQAGLSDKDGSEKISYFVIEVPKVLADFGVGFSAGTQISPGVWKIPAGSEVGLKMVFPQIPEVNGAWWKNPDYIIPQGTHDFKVTVVNTETNLSGVECDYTDNTNSASAHVKVVIFSSPLVLDLNGDGLNLTDADHGVYFDINGDGAVDKTGWVAKEDGLLTLDKNHNGLIDGQSELFGGATEDGFTVLAQYDQNADGVIDSKDSVWKDLTVWQDANQDGISQDGELTSLDSHGFASISLDATATDYQVAGNGVSAESSVTGADGKETLIADAWFAFYSGSDELQMAAAKANEPVSSVVETTAQPVVINNFDVAEDKIDLSSLIDNAACDVTCAIQDFVFSRTENGNTVISLDTSGSGSASAAVDVVVLQGVCVQQVEDIVQIAQQQQSQSGFGTA